MPEVLNYFILSLRDQQAYENLREMQARKAMNIKYMNTNMIFKILGTIAHRVKRLRHKKQIQMTLRRYK